MPQFSVLLPTHNRADVLPLAVRSVLNQTCQDLELLIVGDGCTDGTAEVVGDFGDSRIRWFDLPKAPYFGYANRNVALHEVTGRLVAYMTHDDLWLPDHLQLLSACLEDHDAEFAYSRCLWAGPHGALSPSFYNLNHPSTLEEFLRRPWMMPSTCVMHRRECLDKYGYLDEARSAAADWELWTRIINGGGGANFAYLPVPTCLHFRAKWRTDDQAWMPSAWKVRRYTMGLLPPVRTVPVAKGIAAQEAIWTALSADPPRWTRDLRTAVFESLDNHAARSEQFVLRALHRVHLLKNKFAASGTWPNRFLVRLLGRR